jgi:hypothetical protein
MKLCFVSVNDPREPYLLDEPRIIKLGLVVHAKPDLKCLYI